MPTKRKAFRIGQYVQDRRTGTTYGVGWVNRDGLRLVAQDGRKVDVAWPDAYRYYQIV